ncbi:MAG: hypothetical protein JWM80_2251 [Cyanobacteria bacterium RYN_339]|nr:hypothetical protein [Cyanobacteria bacterium RYN_339]
MQPTRALAALVLMTALALPARADDTALNDGRFGPEPIGGGITGAESAIRMVREDLQFVVGKRDSSVSARFVFQNSLAVPARQLVGFPDTTAAQLEANRRDPKGNRNITYERGVQGPILDMITKVDGRSVDSTLRFGMVKGTFDGWTPSHDDRGFLMAWHAMWVDFPPKRPVVIERRYHTASGTNVVGQAIFDYVVGSGGIWKGTIGELVADVTLKDGLTVKDLAWDAKDGRNGTPGKAAWQIKSPTQLRLVWQNFEPRGTRKYDHIQLITLPTIGSDGKPLKKR